MMDKELCNDSVEAIRSAQFADILNYAIPDSKDKTGYLIWLSSTKNRYVYENNQKLPMRFASQKNAIDVVRAFNEKLPIFILCEPSESEKTNSEQLHKYANGHLSEIDWIWRRT